MDIMDRRLGLTCFLVYNTETEVGVAIKESGVARDDLFITTKSVGLDDVEKALESSLDKLHIDYVDM